MYNKKERYLIRDNVQRTLFLKYKYTTIIHKSLFHNRNLLSKQKLLAFYKLSLKKKGYKKYKNICIKSGENTSINKKLLITRFQINYLSIVNKLQNYKVNSW